MTKEPLPLEEELLRDVNDLLRSRLASAAISQAELARRMGVSRSRVTHVMSGKNLTLRSLAQVATALGIRVRIEVRDEVRPSTG